MHKQTFNSSEWSFVSSSRGYVHSRNQGAATRAAAYDRCRLLTNDIDRLCCDAVGISFAVSLFLDPVSASLPAGIAKYQFFVLVPFASSSHLHTGNNGHNCINCSVSVQ